MDLKALIRQYVDKSERYNPVRFSGGRKAVIVMVPDRMNPVYLSP
jgi:hypothetical protein